jgi:hypothetical protein
MIYFFQVVAVVAFKKNNYGKLIVEIPVSSLTGNVGIVIREPSPGRSTLLVIPDEQLVTGKSGTGSIEETPVANGIGSPHSNARLLSYQNLCTW